MNYRVIRFFIIACAIHLSVSGMIYAAPISKGVTTVPAAANQKQQLLSPSAVQPATDTLQQGFTITSPAAPALIRFGVTSPGPVYLDLSWNGPPLTAALQNDATRQIVASVPGKPTTMRLTYNILPTDIQKGYFWTVSVSAPSPVSGSIRIISPKADQALLAKAMSSQPNSAALPAKGVVNTAIPGKNVNLAGLPIGAKLVNAVEWTKLKSQPDFRIIDQQLNNTLKLAAQKQLSEDEAEIRKAERIKGVRLMPREVTPDENTIALADGNWLHTVDIKGEKRQYTLMGSQWSKHAVASALRKVGTPQNQLHLYENIFKKLDKKIVDKLALVDPELIKKNGNKFPPVEVAKLNQKLGRNVHEMINQYNSPLASIFASKCADNYGQGNMGDEHGNKYDCTFSSKGIYANFPFQAQPHLTCVKDQDHRGSCTAFAVAADFEYKVHNKTGQFVNLSEQALYNQTKLNWFRDDFQDGSWPYKILEKMESTQWPLPFENQWNYNPSHSRVATMAQGSTTQVASYSHSCDSYSETCSDTTHQGQAYCTDQAGHHECGYTTPNINPNGLGFRATSHGQIWDPADPEASINLILLSLIFKNPVIWGFEVNYGWDANDTGFVKYFRNQPSRGGHATLIVGYINNDTLARILPNAPQAKNYGYFIVKNSWSNCFGDGGYAYVPYEYLKEYTYEATVMQGVQ